MLAGASQSQSLDLPVEWRPEIEEYHSETRWWGSSMIAGFREHGPRWAHDAYVARTLPADSATPTMEIGTVVHLMLEDLSRVRDRVVAAGDNRKSKGYRTARTAHPGKVVVTLPEFHKALCAAHAILYPVTPAATAANAVLVGLPGRSEISHRFTWRNENGDSVPVKVRLDRLVRGRDGGLILADLKTTRNPGRDFERIYHSWGYHAQAALYRAGVYDLTGEWPAVCCVAVRNEPPFDVRFARISPALLALGLRRVELDLAAISRCMASGNWFATWEREITDLSPPAWAEREMSKEEEEIPS
jgi:hypothetical protein